MFTMKRSGLFCFFWLLAGVSYAQQRPQPAHIPTLFGDESPTVSLRGYLWRFTDSTGTLTVRQVIDRQQRGQFRPSAGLTDRQDFGNNTTAVHWLFFEIAAPGQVRPGPARAGLGHSDGAVSRLMLEIEYANLDELELTQVSRDTTGRIVLQSLGLTGDRFQFSQRPYRNNNYVYPLQLRAGQTAGYYLRLNQPYATLSFFMRLWHRPAFLAADRSEYFSWGMFVGIICLMAVLNMVMLLALRDWIYGWYSLFLHFFTMQLFSDAGLGFQYLWPGLPRLNEFLPTYLYVWPALVAQATFMQYFIRQNRRNSRVFRWVNAFKIFVMVCLAVAILVPLLQVPGREAYLYQAVSLATSCFVPVIVVLTVLSLREPDRQTGRYERGPMVRYYGYALTVQFAGILLIAVMNFCQAEGWPLPFDIESYVVVRLTVLIDLVFFSYGLTHRYTTAQQHNQQLALNLLQSRQTAQQQVISSLEDERRRLAQDLHDDIGPLLATAKGYLSRLARGQQPGPLQRAQTLLDEAADELRTLSHQLLPGQPGQTNLASAIAELCRQLARRGVPVQFMSLGAARPLGTQREQLLFGLATQLIRNARNLAGTTEVTVQLLYHEEQVNLSVEDDGPPTRLSPADAAHLQAKADLLKADLLTEATNAGNSVMLSVLTAAAVPI